MKKIIMLFLIVAIATSLCACGGNSGNGTGNKLSLGEPTEEELEMIDEYLTALEALDEYAETGRISFYEYDENEDTVEWKGQDALKRWYQYIEEAEEVDKWIGTNYCADTRTRQEILDSFDVVDDVLLAVYETQYSQLGKVVGTENEWIASWRYNKEGKFKGIDGYLPSCAVLYQVDDIRFCPKLDPRAYFNYIYDENGQIVEINYGDTFSYDDYISVPQYNANGTLVGELLERNGGDLYEIHYTYDTQGNLTKISSNLPYPGQGDGESCEYLYTYDENGNIIREENNVYDSIREYVYNEDGVLTSGTFHFEDEQLRGVEIVLAEEYKFNCNEKGQILSVEITHHENQDSGSTAPDWSTATRTYEYGSYYIYEPSK